jgi:hypothetical protein
MNKALSAHFQKRDTAFSQSQALPVPRDYAAKTGIRVGVEFFFLFAIVACTLEGAVRKWVIPSEGYIRYLMYFSKDVLFAACLLLPATAKPNQLAKQYRQWIALGVVLTLVGAMFAMAGANVVGAVLSLRSMIVLPILAMYVMPRLHCTTFVKAIKVIAILCMLNAVLAFVQFFSPQDSFINKYASEGTIVATAAYSRNVRAAGSFSYITGLTVFSSVAFAAGLVLNSIANRKRERVIASLALGAAVLCAAATVSRAAVLGIVVIFVAWTFLSKQSSRMLGGLAIGSLVGYVGLNLFGILEDTTEILVAVQRRHAAAHDTIIGRILEPIAYVPEAVDTAPFGLGIGTEQVGGNYFSRGRMSFTTYESEWPRIIMEIGAIGFVGFLITHVSSLFLLYNAWRAAPRADTQGALLAMLLVCAFLFYGGVVFNHVSSFYYWSIVAMTMTIDGKKRPL